MLINLSKESGKKIEEISKATNLKNKEILEEALKFYFEKKEKILFPDRFKFLQESSGSCSGAETLKLDGEGLENLLTAGQIIKERFKRYQALFKSMNHGFYFAEVIYDKDGNPSDYRYDEINPAFQKIMNIKPDQIIGKTYNELVPPDPASGWVECFKRVVKTGTPEHYEFYSEVYKQYFDTYAFVPLEGYFAVLVTDITEKKHAEEELIKHRENLEGLVAERTAELDKINADLLEQIIERKKIEEELTNTKTLLEQTFEQSPIPMILVSMPDGVVRIINSASMDLFGAVDEEPVVGKRLMDIKISHKEYDPLWNEVTIENHPLALALTGKITTNQERIIVRKDGTIRWELVNATPIYNIKGEIIAGYVVMNDITKLKQEEEALKISEKNLEEAQNLAELGYIDWDLNTNKVFWSKETFKIFGFDPNNFTPTTESTFGIVYNDDKESVRNLLEATVKGNMEFKSEHRVVRPDGTIIYINARGNVSRDAGGKPSHFMIIVVDITERKKSESERLRLQNLESLGILAGGIAHDFNNILSAILGHASIAINDISDEKLRNSLTSIIKATRRATGLTQQLLTFAKGGKPDKCAINLRKIIQDTAKFALSGSNVTAEYDLKETFSIEADPGQIAQVIQNLVINAKQAMPLGGNLHIITENYRDSDENNYVKLIIEDHGIGISKEQIDKIFDPYFTTKQTGSGLGLSVCHSIIKRHDGKIFVKSDIDKGTTFTILLPASNRENIMKDNKREIILNKLNILIMDDDEDIRDFLSVLLIKDGHNVTVSREGREAIKIYKEEKEKGKVFDLVFMDLTVKGGMGGKEAVKILREYDPKVKVIVSSGYADSSLVNYKEDGFDGMLKKPYTWEELTEAIFNVLNF